MNKKGAGPVESWIDYLLLFVMALFAFMFLFASLSLSLIFRDDATVKTAESLQTAENLLNEQKVRYVQGDQVDIPQLKNKVNYLNTYKQLPDQEIGLQLT